MSITVQQRFDNLRREMITQDDIDTSIELLALAFHRRYLMRLITTMAFAEYVHNWELHHQHLWTLKARQSQALTRATFDLNTATAMVRTFYKQIPATAKAFAGIGGLDVYLANNVKFCFPTDIQDRLSVRDLRALVHLLLVMALKLRQFDNIEVTP